MNFNNATKLISGPAVRRFAFVLIAMVLGAIAWPTVTSVARYRAEQKAPAIGLVLILDTEQALTNLNDKANPDSALKAAARLTKTVRDLKSLDIGGLSEFSTKTTPFVKEADEDDFSALLGYPDDKCFRSFPRKTRGGVATFHVY